MVSRSDCLSSHIFMQRTVKFIPVILFAAFLLWIITDADGGRKNIFVNFAHSIPNGDKIGHVFIYGLLTLLANLALSRHRVSLWTKSIPLGTTIVLIFAIVEEFTQLFFVARTFDWIDMACDIVGIGVFTIVSELSYTKAEECAEK